MDIVQRFDVPPIVTLCSTVGRPQMRSSVEHGWRWWCQWTADEEEALLAGIKKHGPGKWKNILKDPEFARFLTHRSNIDLKVPLFSSFSG